jgi:hypothetical protein
VVLATWRRFSQLHEDDRLVALAASSRGRWLVWLIASLLMLRSGLAWYVVPSTALVMLMPDRRRLVLSIGAIAAAVEYLVPRQERMGGDFPPAPWLPVVLALLLFAGLLIAAFLAARSFRRLPGPVRKRPQIFAHLFLWAVLLAHWSAPGDGSLGPAVLALTAGLLLFVIFRVNYLLLSGKRGHVAGTRLRDHAFYLFPGFGGTHTPYGKGFDYLSKREAPDAEALARSQLAGIKLLCLSWLWRGVQWAMDTGFYGDDWGLGVPQLNALISEPATTGLSLAWLGLYGNLVHRTLEIAIKGHVIVAGLRLFGFNVYRNTYKPLLSETLIDFWGRYYFFFKELLVEFFFYPTYLKYRKLHPRLRLTLAVFAAAFVGNMYYHLLAVRYPFLEGRFLDSLELLKPRMVYCFLLAAGISFSMIRQRERRGRVLEAAGAAVQIRRLRAIFGVWTFYAIIHVWNVRSASASILDRMDFVLSLVGL